jgi:hypothetical protein
MSTISENPHTMPASLSDSRKKSRKAGQRWNVRRYDERDDLLDMR